MRLPIYCLIYILDVFIFIYYIFMYFFIVESNDHMSCLVTTQIDPRKNGSVGHEEFCGPIIIDIERGVSNYIESIETNTI